MVKNNNKEDKEKDRNGGSFGKIIAAAAAGATAYHFLGPDGKENQKKLADWFDDKKKDISQKSKPILKQAKNITKGMKKMEPKRRKASK